MSLFEKYTDYDKKIKEALSLSYDASILNMEYFKDTGQFNLTLKDSETGRKQEPRACILPEKIRLEIIELIWPVIYKNFKFETARSIIIKEYLLKKAEAEKELQKEKENLESLMEKKISELTSSINLDDEIAEIQAEMYSDLQKTALEKAEAKDKSEIIEIIKKENSIKSKNDEKIKILQEKVSFEKEEKTKILKEELDIDVETITLDFLGPIEEGLTKEIEKASKYFEISNV